MAREDVLKGPNGETWLAYQADWLPDGLVASAMAELDALRGCFEGPGAHAAETVRAPRLVLAFGDEPTAFVDLGGALPWPPALRDIRDRLASEAGHPFNYLLVNWYRDGGDWTGWHSDKTEFHEEGSSIAIVSLGASRDFAFRPLNGPSEASTHQLDHRSVIWMAYALHREYEHAVPQMSSVGERFSLTFRRLRAG
jgi:hypothetical protein